MLINNTKAGVICINYVQAGAKDAVKGHTNKVLLPGNNEVPNEAWAVIGQDAEVQRMIDEGVLVVVLGPDKKATLSQMALSQARKIIKDTLDVDLLTSWLKTETRKDVVDAIQAQVDSLKLPPQAPGADKSDAQ